MGASNVASATQAKQSLEPYAEAFAAFEKEAAGRELPWLCKLRREGFDRFNAVGFPTLKDEDWRFTNLAPIVQTSFRLRNGNAPLSPKAIERFRISSAACTLVFLDGHFTASLSSLGALPRGVTVASLAEELAKNPGAVEPHLGRYLNIQRDPFCALNTAFIEDGAYIHIAKNVVLEAPIYLLFISASHEFPAVSYPRNLIVVEESAQATIVEDYVSLGGKALCNTATELVAGDNAVVSHYMIEREDMEAFNVSTLRIQQGRSADVASHSVLIGGAPAKAASASSTVCSSAAIVSISTTTCSSSTPARIAAAGSFTTAFSQVTRTACFMGASSSTKTRKRPTPNRPIATCCFPIPRRSTRSRS